MNTYRCPFCTKVPASHKNDFIAHIKSYHNLSLNRCCNCPYDDCNLEFVTLYKYFTHVDKIHSDFNDKKRKKNDQDPSLDATKPAKKKCINLPSTSSTISIH